MDGASRGGPRAPGARLRGLRRRRAAAHGRRARDPALDRPPPAGDDVGLERLAGPGGQPPRRRRGGVRARLPRAGPRVERADGRRARVGDGGVRPGARPRRAFRRRQPASPGHRLQGHGARGDRGPDRGAQAARRGDCRGGERRAGAARDRHRLLRHDRLLRRARRLRAGGRVDDRGEPLVRPPRRDGLPGRVPHSPGADPAAPGRLAAGGGAGDPGLRGAPGLQPLRDRAGVLRDR